MTSIPTGFERRNAPRIDLTLRVVLVVGRRVFRTSCDNISEGGILLSSQLPNEYRHPDLTLVIQSPSGHRSIISHATFVDGIDQRRLRFVDMKDEDQLELHAWLSK